MSFLLAIWQALRHPILAIDSLFDDHEVGF